MNRIKEVLDEKGVKQKWLADQLGKSYNMVNGYVQNRQQPRLKVLYEIARILDVSVKDLIVDGGIVIYPNPTLISATNPRITCEMK